MAANKFLEILEKSKMTMKQFSDCFEIPYRTVQSWKAGERACPDYVIKLIEYKLANESKEEEKVMMTDLQILMMDGCTKSEAEKHLQRGTIVYDDMEEHLEDYIEEFDFYDEEEEQKFRAMVAEKKPMEDWGIVEEDGRTYFIAYCL